MVVSVRLRQVVLITRDLPTVVGRFETVLGVGDGFQDESVGQFGLENRVLAVGDCFIEVLTPVTQESSGHRYLARRGGDGGYMAIFQFRDREAPRRRAVDLGVRIVFQADLDDMSGTHLDPRDVPGAIVSLDWADPPESWRWAGPRWRRGSAGVPAGRRGGITSLEVAVADPAAAAARWAAVLGDDVALDGSSIRLPEADQALRFVQSSLEREGIIGCGLVLEALAGRALPTEVEIGGVRFTVGPLDTTTTEEVT
jgi:hypothetical protein